MDLLLDVDLDWLCLGAEAAAGLLILSLAWRPGGRTAESSEVQVASTIDWEPLQDAHVLAVTGTGRSLSLRSNPMDEQRLKDLLVRLPNPYRDRLTGTWNAHGMDRLICEWSCEPDLGAYPSCYAVFTLSDADQMLEQLGAACIEQAMIKLSELLTKSIGCSACISRYQPHSFLIHLFGKSLPECQDSLAILCEQVSAPEFFSFHEETISLRCETFCWYCDRGVDPEALLHLLSEFTDESSSGEEETYQEEAVAAEAGFAPEPKKAFSLDDLAPFPCPWDSPSDEPSEPNDLSPQMDPGDLQPETSQSLEGFASSGQIDELLAQLSTDVATEPIADQTVQALGTGSENVQSSASEKQAAASEKEMPEPEMELPSSHSISPTDIEESNLKDDLDSLFATVRSSAVNELGHPGEPKPDR